MQPIVEVPQVADNNPVNQATQELPETLEQPVEQHTPRENISPTLRRSTTIKKPSISSDYKVYLQESDYNIGAENDPESVSQAMNSK